VRARILIFLAVLLLDAAFVDSNPLAMAIGVAAYVIIVLPTLKRSDD
jgi:hypothetical protein